jgi:hypothetical protein
MNIFLHIFRPIRPVAPNTTTSKDFEAIYDNECN